MSNSTCLVSVTSTKSLLWIVMEVSASIKSHVTSPGPSADRRIVLGSVASSETTIFFTLRTTSDTSSVTPSRLVNSCSAPWILTRVTAAPSRLDSRMRRRLVPTVVPNPRSNGSTANLPYVSSLRSLSGITWLGNSSPRHLMRIICLQRCSAIPKGFGLGKRVRQMLC